MTSTQKVFEGRMGNGGGRLSFVEGMSLRLIETVRYIKRSYLPM